MTKFKKKKEIIELEQDSETFLNEHYSKKANRLLPR